MNTWIPIEEKNIHIYGRTNEKNPLALFWTGSGLEFVVDGSELYLDVETDYQMHEQWIRVEINDCTMVRMPLPKGRNQIAVYRGFNKENVRKVRIFKEVQPMRMDSDNRLLVYGITADGVLHQLPKKNYKLEFIGDSITSGEGLAGAKDMTEWCSAIFSTNGNYAVETAKMLNADVRILSQSGWGVCTSWDNDPKRTLPMYYEKLCGFLRGTVNEKLGSGNVNDFTKWQPDAVIINLGSNDGFAFDNPPWTDLDTGEVTHQKRNPDGSLEKESTDRFEKAVYDFLVKLRNWNPDSQLVWAYGMIYRTMKPYIEHAVQQYIEDTQDKKVSFLLLPDLKEEWVGANNHPGKAAHLAAAEVLTGALERLLSK